MIRFIIIICLCLLSGVSKSQKQTGSEASKLVTGAETVHIDENTKLIKLARFSSPNPRLNFSQASNWLVQTLKISEENEFKQLSEQTDQLGYTHTKFQQLYMQVPVEGTAVTIHTKDGLIESFSGSYFNVANLSLNQTISASEALQLAESYMDARILQEREPNTPPAQLVILPLNDTFYLAYKTDVYAMEPMSRQYIFVDATSGAILWTIDRIHIIDAAGTAETRYSGVREITTDSLEAGFYLRDNTRGDGVITYDLHGYILYSNSTHITDSDNFWESEDHDANGALDAHWGTERTYDYFLETHDRNSIDNQGSAMVSYVDYDFNYSNAFWNGIVMTYGAGGIGESPYTSLDVVAHEVTHGITQYTAGLIYSGESGALNESFSDIFGVVVDFYARAEEGNYLVGDLIRPEPFRSMSDPNLYNSPDTYLGNFWGGGVHTNSGVQNYWFYLLAEGGSGINDLGNDYFVEGIGRDAAANIAYRNLTVYLNPSSDYDEARIFSIQSAIDLFGDCSGEVESVTNAWYAVGVGDDFNSGALASYTQSNTFACEVPASIHFFDLSTNAESWFWDFGNGTHSTEQNPTAIYGESGIYTVTLTTASIPYCGIIDTLTTESIITISDEGVLPEADCSPVTLIPSSDHGIANVELGTISKTSGPSIQGYRDYTCTHSATLSEGHMYELEINTYSSEFVKVWIDLNNNGSFTTDEIIYSSGSASISHAQSIIIPEGSVYNTPLRMRVQSSGSGSIGPCDSPITGQVEDYRVLLLENNAAPVALFEALHPVVIVNDTVHFSDVSLNLPENWQWNFQGGIPISSSSQNPSISYAVAGNYNVSLNVSNAYGIDTLLIENYIQVVNSYRMCNAGTIAAHGGTLYDSGGAFFPYGNNENCGLLISPSGCVQRITLSFADFHVHPSDRLKVYDGPDDSSPLLLSASTHNIPDAVTAESGKMYLVFTSDFYTNGAGFIATWTTEFSSTVPMADFLISNVNPPLNYTVDFIDQSTEYPSEWFWNFGDGNTAHEQNPQHIYSTPGNYSVMLISYNCFGSDTTYQNVSVQEAPSIYISPFDTVHASIPCGSMGEGSFTIYNNGEGDLAVNTEGSNFVNVVAQVLALVAYTPYEEGYSNTIMAINAHFTDYELTESWAETGSDLEADLIGKDILLIPEQIILHPSKFTSLAPVFVDFVVNGGSILICSNEGIETTGLLNGASTSLYYGPLTRQNIAHPILENIPSNIPNNGLVRPYIWTDDEITTLISPSPNPFESVVAVKNIGEGTVVYIGSDFSYNSPIISQLIGNAMQFLDEKLETAWVESTSLDSTTIIAPGDSLVVTIQFNASELLSDLYYFDLLINSNDLSSVTDTIVLQLTVNGEPILVMSDDELNFGSLMAGITTTDTLIIYNTGCQGMSISTNLSSNDFSVQQENLFIPPLSQDTLFVNFQPTEPGSFNEILTILSNGGDEDIILTGEAFAAPNIQVTPEVINIDLSGCTDSILVNFTISNIGEGTLEVTNLYFDTKPPLEEVQDKLFMHNTDIVSLVPNVFYFSGGNISNYISDGGNDMYDNGNYLNTNYQSGLAYSSAEINVNNAFGPSGRYFTAKYPGLFVMAADIDDLDFFSITGDLGSDGLAQVEASVLSYSHISGADYTGFVTRVFGSFNPSINHLIITKDLQDITHAYLSDTYLEDHSVENLNGTDRLYYLLFAAENGGYLNNQSMQNIFEAFINTVSPAPTDNGDLVVILEPGQSANLEVSISTSEYQEGINQIPLLIRSNDPDQPVDTLLVNLVVSDELCPNFTHVPVNICNGEISFTDLSTNNPTSWNWNFGDGNTSTDPNPIHTYEETGTYLIILEVCNESECNSSYSNITIENVLGPLSTACLPYRDDYLPENYISEVIIAGIPNSSGGGLFGYQDFSCSSLIPLNIGMTYPWEVTVSYTHYNKFTLWLDYNGDGQFSSDELISDDISLTLQDDGIFTVAENALLNQPLRLRVIVDFYLDEPCGEIGFGEAEDYTVFITTPNSPPVTVFSLAPLEECQGNYQFTDYTGNQPTSWLWDFGDGNTSTDQNPTHQYESAGDYVVMLTAYNNFGNNSYAITITALPSGFDDIVISGTQIIDLPISFTAEGEGIENWTWDFGDGTIETSNSPNITHTYTELGIYTMTVSTPDDVCRTSISTQINMSLTGIDGELSAKSLFLLYPNPSDGSFSLIPPQGELAEQVLIYDVIGREISFEKTTENREKIIIKIQEPVAGMYMLVLRTVSGNLMKSRIVIQ